MLEVAIAVALLTIGFLGFGSLFVMNARSFDLADQESLVLNSLRETAEKIRTAPFSQIATTYQGYTAVIGSINAPVTVTFFLDETATSPDAVKLGLPRDLNGDGVATSTNVSANYNLLPVKIEASWTNLLGAHSEAVYLMLAQEKN